MRVVSTMVLQHGLMMFSRERQVRVSTATDHGGQFLVLLQAVLTLWVLWVLLMLTQVLLRLL
jgi:hypothetical protein